jgi:hypothetical protein
LHTLHLCQLYLLHFLFPRKGQNPNLGAIPKKKWKETLLVTFQKQNPPSPTHNSWVPGQNSKSRSWFLKKKRKRNVSNVPKTKINKIPPSYSQFPSSRPKFQVQEPVPKEKKKKGTLVTFQIKEISSTKPTLTISEYQAEFQVQEPVPKEKKKKRNVSNVPKQRNTE